MISECLRNDIGLSLGFKKAENEVDVCLQSKVISYPILSDFDVDKLHG